MGFIKQKYLIVNLFLYVANIYYRAIKNVTSEMYVLKHVIMYEQSEIL